MTPQSESTEKDGAEVPGLQEEFVRQVEDHSLPAKEVLMDQQEGRAAPESPSLFIP